jgi:TMEM199 family protein
MVFLVTTPTILTALQALPPSSREKLGLQQEKTIGSPISHEQLIALGKALKELQNGQIGNAHSLDSLLRGTQVYIPPAPPKPEPVGPPTFIFHILCVC